MISRASTPERDAAEIAAAIGRSARQAALDHARAGRSVPVWRDGKIVELSPDRVQAEIAAIHESSGDEPRPSQPS